MKKTGTWVYLVAFTCVILFTGLTRVAANAVENRFAGKVLILKRKPPSYFKTKGGFVGFLRKNSIKTVHEGEDRTWTFETMAFFRKPLGDYEIEMVFYDVKNGRSKSQRRFVNSYTQYTQDRNTRSLSGKTKLVRPHFDANKKYMIVAQSHGRELAKGEFTTRGTSQAMIDQQTRYKYEQKQMEKSMKELERKVKEQEKKEKEESNKAAQDLF